MRQISTLILLIIILTTLLSCDAKKTDASTDGDKESEKEEKPVSVRVQSLKLQMMAPTVELSGKISSEHDVTVVSETSGQVVNDKLELGKAVSKGAVLVEVDAEPYTIQLSAAQAGVSQAKTLLDQAKRNYERGLALKESGDISDSDFDTVKFAYDGAKAGLSQANSAVASAERALRLTQIRAPFGGEIAAKHTSLGNTLAPGSPVATIVDNSALKLVVGVGEDDIAGVRIGLKASVRIPTLQEEAFSATVSAVGIKAIQPSMSYPAELKFDDTIDGLRVGMVARVDLPTAEEKNLLVVPLEVVVDRFGHNFLYVVKGDRAEERRIETGIKFGKSVVVEDGVKEGDVIVVSGQSNLKDGSLIQVVE